MANAQNAARTAKVDEVTRIRESFDKAVSAVVVDFRGLTVEKVTELRKRFRASGVEYRVVKNTLVEKALADSDLGKNEAFTQSLTGPTGIAWSFEDPSVAAKIIKNFRKEDPLNEEALQLKAGVLDGHVFDAKGVENQLATLPGKDEIRAMLLALLQAPAQSLVRQLFAPGQSLAYALDAKSKQDS